MTLASEAAHAEYGESPAGTAEPRGTGAWSGARGCVGSTAAGAPGNTAFCGGNGALTGATTLAGTEPGLVLRLPSTATGARACATDPWVPVADTAARAPITAPTNRPTATKASTARNRYARALTTGSTDESRLGYEESLTALPPRRFARSSPYPHVASLAHPESPAA